MSESNEVVERYLATADEVRLAFSGMTREQFLARPVPGKWSAMEVLCHLVDTDFSTAMRIRSTLVLVSPRLPGVTKEQMTTVLAPEHRDAPEEVQCFRLIRSQTARIIQALPGDALNREAILLKANGEEVVRTISQFLSGITSHVVHHLGFVHEKRHALGLRAWQFH